MIKNYNECDDGFKTQLVTMMNQAIQGNPKGVNLEKLTDKVIADALEEVNPQINFNDGWPNEGEAPFSFVNVDEIGPKMEATVERMCS